MPSSKATFGGLLKQGVQAIKANELNKNLGLIRDELGHSIGRDTGGSSIQHWERGNIPQNKDEIENLAREIIKRSNLDRNWLQNFLYYGEHTRVKEICNELFPISAPTHDREIPLVSDTDKTTNPLEDKQPNHKRSVIFWGIGTLVLVGLFFGFFMWKKGDIKPMSIDIISNLSVISDKTYIIDYCVIGGNIYIDRNEKFFATPDPYTYEGEYNYRAYDGLPCIKTANDDKKKELSEFLKFYLERPATISIIYDSRVDEDAPDWLLEGFALTEDRVFENGDDMGFFDVYSCNATKGNITIPANKYGTDTDKVNTMYVIFFSESAKSSKACQLN